MHNGRIEQTASPAELYDRPATRFVASFIGTMNLVPVRFLGVENGKLRLDGEGMNFDIPADDQPQLAPGAVAALGVRPEDFVLATEGAPQAFRAEVSNVVFHGKALRVHATAGKVKIVIDLPRQGEGRNCEKGTVLFVALRDGASCVLLPP